MAIILRLGELTGFEWFCLIAGTIVCLGMLIALYRLLDCQNMSDKEREKWGLGPLGQGRGRRNNEK